jgi:hypothetical protein
MENFVMTNALKYLALIAGLGLVPSTAALAEDHAPPLVTHCSGNAQEFVNHNTRNFPATTSSTNFRVVPDTFINGFASGPAGDADTYVVTFSAEANMNMAASSWEAQAQYSINGGGWIDMDPVGPNTFHSGNAAETHTMTWCDRLEATISADFRIRWRVTPAGTATADDYTMRVERSD